MLIKIFVLRKKNFVHHYCNIAEGLLRIVHVNLLFFNQEHENSTREDLISLSNVSGWKEVLSDLNRTTLGWGFGKVTRQDLVYTELHDRQFHVMNTLYRPNNTDSSKSNSLFIYCSI